MTSKTPHADPIITPELVKQHGLTPEEFERIKKILGRDPNFTELGIYFREPVLHYSHGMLTRLAFALSMAIEFECFLIDEAMVVGDAKPFIGALITIDPEAFDGWKQRNNKAADASVADLVTDPDLVAEVDAAVKQANLSVSHAESIRKFRILPVDFTEDTGELTPTMKVKRNVVAEKFASDIEAIYVKD